MKDYKVKPVESLYMETTKKEPEDTMADIKKLLKNYGMTRFSEIYKDGELYGCMFEMQLLNESIVFSLPANWLPLWQRAQRGETKYIKDKQQAIRVACRQVLKWVEAQLALVDIGMVEFQEVFLPYAMVDKDTTLYQSLVSNDFKLLLME